ncbi:hypothetical protein [Bacillus horti]|uniref:Uncharacterized protein (UPF0333 family) n=1 Tax=Caldalkalibacillus horti TaxID=77523 RepID=A0ABT9VWE6_9BACI|nr:hypothetical protein [Bacillus horti]MDQ0165215.1 uncharacterized protein (UPF0333 family) [Bacillus horti]
MLNIYVKAKAMASNLNQRVESLVKNEKGSISLEWIMIGLLGVAIIGVVATWLSESGSGGTLGNAILSKLADLVGNIGGG